MFLCVFCIQIGEGFVVDCSGAEQDCSSCILSIAVDRSGRCCGIKYLKRGTFTAEEIAEAVVVSVFDCLCLNLFKHDNMGLLYILLVHHCSLLCVKSCLFVHF
jgi:hypothetical protein